MNTRQRGRGYNVHQGSFIWVIVTLNQYLELNKKVQIDGALSLVG